MKIINDRVFIRGKFIAYLETEKGLPLGNITIFNIETTPGGSNKGYGTKILKHLFKTRGIKTIDGTATKKAYKFWKKVGADFINKPGNNGDTEFILEKDKFIKKLFLKKVVSRCRTTRRNI